ncbi:MAG: energy transducer TonB [Thermoanaerobaculales bacterium]|jgi:hypothetical protein|nr:energy transducer TonB [Thermoanaerobaculales bacterium]
MIPRRAKGLGIIAALTVAFFGCASAPDLDETEPPASSRRGLVSYEQVVDPAAVRPVAEVGHEYLRPRLEAGFTLPAYPEPARAGDAPLTEVVVRVVIAADGSVEGVRPSPLAAEPPNDWSPIFFEAVRAAVSDWRYDPCQLRRLENGPDRDGDGRPDYTVVVDSTPVSVYLDLRFRFEIVDGVGEVSMD